MAEASDAPESTSTNSTSTNVPSASFDAPQPDKSVPPDPTERSISAGVTASPAPGTPPQDVDAPSEEATRSAGALTPVDLQGSPGSGERFSRWRDKKTRRWSLLLLPFSLMLGTLGTLADWQGAMPGLPCWAKSEEKIAAPYGIAVANVAIRLDVGRQWSSDEEENAQEVNQALFDQINEGFQDSQGKVGVGRTCDSDIQSTGGREAYLSDVQADLDGELAVSLTLTPSGERNMAEIDLSIGSRDGWNEAQELAGYYKFDAGMIGDSLEIEASILNASVAELLTPYIKTLRAIANYANTDYDAVITIVDDVLTTSNIPEDLAKLAYVLKGNAEGRLGRPGSVDRAEAAYMAARAIDPGYARAILGLAEIDYQKGLSQIEHAGPKCDGELTPQARTYLDAAVDKYENVYSAASTSRVPDVDLRAAARR